jgi:L-fuconolactonase
MNPGVFLSSAERRVDAHQHFWRYDAQQYPWIQQDWPIRKSFLPGDLQLLLAAEGFHSCVAVQARQSMEETLWLLDLAEKHPFIAGVVGWINLLAYNSKAVAAQLERLNQSERSKLVGVRHVVQDEPDDAFMLRADFLCGIASLKEYGLTYDLLIFPKQLHAAIQLVRKFPEQPFVLDHIAKPIIREGKLIDWQNEIRELAKLPNVMCKLSGMVTEARWKDWRAEDFKPYLDVVWDAFGEDRLMIGSDWPVCLLSAEYSATLSIVKNYLNQFSAAAQAKVLGGNATRFYKLKFD